MNKFVQKTEIYYGKNAIKNIKKIDGEKVFIVTDDSMIKLDFLPELTFMLDEQKIDWSVYRDVEQDPTLEIVKNAFKRFIDFKPDTIIALGGGSVIDAAKATLYLYMKGIELFLDKKSLIKPFFIAIPTTSGTGSEVTSYSVVTDTKDKTKIPLVDSIMIPDMAILDTQLTLTIPPNITADTGLDVLTHSIEAYVAKNSTDFTDNYAEKSIEYVLTYLIRAYKNGKDTEAREKMHIASCMAGLAFTHSGLGINHSIAHTVGGRFNISHGRSNAILLPYVIEFNSKLGQNPDSGIGGKYANISKKLGFPASTTEEGIISLMIGIERLRTEMKVPKTFKEAGIDKEEFYRVIDEMAQTALKDPCTQTNPRDVKLEDIVQILEKSYSS